MRAPRTDVVNRGSPDVGGRGAGPYCIWMAGRKMVRFPGGDVMGFQRSVQTALMEQRVFNKI